MKLKLTVDGKVYEVDVEVAEPEQPHPSYIPPTSRAVPRSGEPGTTAAPKSGGQEVVADESKVCRSPISGVVVRVSAQVGQVIQVNDVMMVLEAMKMETEITSPVNGKIAQVKAQTGDSVQTGQVLIEFE